MLEADIHLSTPEKFELRLLLGTHATFRSGFFFVGKNFKYTRKSEKDLGISYAEFYSRAKLLFRK